MSANTFGERLKVTTFGESHGPAYGVVIDGMPAGLPVNEELLKSNLRRRRPGANYTTSRNESDQYEVLSGIFEGKTLGTPIAVVVRNTDQKSEDYADTQLTPRIGHADDTWKSKFAHVDFRGGGRSSGRETLCRVIAGSFAEMLVKSVSLQTTVDAYPIQIGEFDLSKNLQSELPSEVKSYLEKAKESGESYGGVALVCVGEPPRNLGQPVFHKIKNDLASAIFSLGAVTGLELGSGFSATEIKGTEFHQTMTSGHYGGIRGGITTGECISVKVAFKPTSSIKDIAKKGRHDPCIVPRALPVLEAMTWLVLADHYLWSKTDRLDVL